MRQRSLGFSPSIMGPASWSRLSTMGSLLSEAVRVLISRHYTVRYRMQSTVEPAPFGPRPEVDRGARSAAARSEEHTSELQPLMRTSYAVFCLTITNT